MSHVSVLLMLAALTQSPAGGGWLDSVPVEADVAVRVSAATSVRDDLVAMIKAMTPEFGEQAEKGIGQGIQQFAQQFGEPATTHPFVVAIRAVAPENPAAPPFAVIVRSDEPDAVLKSLGGGKELTFKKEEGGLESFEGPGGATWYTAKPKGHVAFGPDKTLIAAIAKGGEHSVGKTVNAADRARFDAGDVAVHVNLKAIVGRYEQQIDQAKASFMALLDQAGGQVGNAGMMEGIKKMYGGMFDGTKQTDTLTFNIDFAAEGLTVDGALDVKADSAASKLIAGSKTGDAAALAKIPAEAAYFVYMNIDAKSYHALSAMGMSFLSPTGKPSAESEALVKKLDTAGGIETVGGVSMSGGMKAINITNSSAPKTLLEVHEQSFKEMKKLDGPLNFFKEINVEPNAQEYRGYSFTRVDMVVDKDKLAKLQPNNPAAGDAVLRMYGGDKISSWFAADDKQLLQITAADQETAKLIFDKYSDGQDTIGATESYKTARAKLPKQVTGLALVSAQGIVGQIATQFGAKLPELPKDLALIGGSVTMKGPEAVEFRFVLPSTAGPIFQKGFAPLLGAIRPGGN